MTPCDLVGVLGFRIGLGVSFEWGTGIDLAVGDEAPPFFFQNISVEGYQIQWEPNEIAVEATGVERYKRESTWCW